MLIRGYQGLSLLEIVIALLIAWILLTSTARLMLTATSSVQEGQARYRARTQLQSLLQFAETEVLARSNQPVALPGPFAAAGCNGLSIPQMYLQGVIPTPSTLTISTACQKRQAAQRQLQPVLPTVTCPVGQLPFVQIQSLGGPALGGPGFFQVFPSPTDISVASIAFCAQVLPNTIHITAGALYAGLGLAPLQQTGTQRDLPLQNISSDIEYYNRLSR